MNAERGRVPAIMRAAALAALVALACGAIAQQRIAVPPAEYRPHGIEQRNALETRMLLPRTASARHVALPEPTSAERAPQKAQRASRSNLGIGNKRERLMVGFARTVPPSEATIALADLSWQRTANGSFAARVEYTSPGAAGLRVGLALADAPAQLLVRFQGSASGATAYGPFDVVTIASEPVYWSPVLDGDTAAVEFELPDGVAPGPARVSVPKISHLVATGRALRAFDEFIGTSGPCEKDVVCAPPALQQQLSSATKAVARTIVTIDAFTFLCTATLLNDAGNTFTPWLATANHCLEDPDQPENGRGTAAAAAATLNTYWFFEAATCGSVATPPYIVLAGGAKLLARSIDFDWALVQLKVAPPLGSTFSAWSAEGPIASGTPFEAIHHPSADLKKLSEGYVVDYYTFEDRSTFVRVGWNNGVTEHGSSGSGLFTLNAGANYYELRGMLSGGYSTCESPQLYDYYARFDVAYPEVAEYITPNADNPAKVAAVVEYYNGVEDNYFLTIDPFEIAGRDNGSPPGWVRTGYRFLAYTDPAVAPAGSLPVCRLFAPAPYGNTRFYSASAQECAAMLAQPALHFILESNAAFYLQMPDASGACPSGTRPIYRFLDSGNPPRRRYTAEVDLREGLIFEGGWTQEGNGAAPEQVVMCSPVNGVALPGATVANYQGLWWNAPAGSESGWGINLNHQGDTIFATWFTYDIDGSALWMVVSATMTGPNVYTGTLYRAIGPPFNSMPFDPTKVVGTPVGTAIFTFTDASNAVFSYGIGGISIAKNITRQVFGSPVPTCSWNKHADLSVATNYQDLWWAAPAGSESGWGINFTHQGNTIFATWFTYGPDGKPVWYVVSAVQSLPNVYSGSLFTGTGPAFNGPFDPAKVVAIPAGSVSITFQDGSHATFSYTVNGVSQAKSITREIFAPPGTFCQ